MKQRLSTLGFALCAAVLTGTMLACKGSNQGQEQQQQQPGQTEQGYGTQQSTPTAPGAAQPGTTQPGSTGTPAPGAGR